MHIQQIWRRLTTTRYARALEAELGVERTVVTLQDAEINRQAAEIARLRDENRALLNSILGIAGVPPLPASLDDLASAQNQIAMPPPVARAVIHPSSTPHVTAPMRRRSWPQINRLLEFESAQKEKPTTEPLPPAHQ
jgi:hypothetical protein